MRKENFGRRLIQGTVNQFVYGARALQDPVFYLLLASSLCGWFLGRPPKPMAWDALLGKAFVEEFFFRFLLQEALLRILPRRARLGPLTLANVLVSLGFAGTHLPNQPVVWASMTFFPSLAFGYAWERYRSVLAPTAIHFGYNLLLYHRIFS